MSSSLNVNFSQSNAHEFAKLLNFVDFVGDKATTIMPLAIDQYLKSEKLAGQILTGISGTALAITVIAVPILHHLGIWAALISNPVFLPVFATVVAILILALIIGIILLSYFDHAKSSVNPAIITIRDLAKKFIVSNIMDDNDLKQLVEKGAYPLASVFSSMLLTLLPENVTPFLSEEKRQKYKSAEYLRELVPNYQEILDSIQAEAIKLDQNDLAKAKEIAKTIYDFGNKIFHKK